MAFHSNSQPQEPQQSRDFRSRPPGNEVISKKPNGKVQKSNKELLDSGYMSDCTVICENTKWTTHKVILCSRNKWFRAALDSSFQEAYTGVVTIEDTDPEAVQVVLDYIYTGQINHYNSTPAKIVQIWKAGDFFGIRDLAVEAENLLMRRLKASAEFFRFSPEPKRKTRPHSNCEEFTFEHGCGHTVPEKVFCDVRDLRPCSTVFFKLCEPLEPQSYTGNVCGICEYSQQGCLSRRNPLPVQPRPRRPIPSKDPEPPIPPDDKTRAMIEEEILALRDALVTAIAETPEDSSMRKQLIHHMCNTRVAAWEGFTVCRFLEEIFPK